MICGGCDFYEEDDDVSGICRGTSILHRGLVQFDDDIGESAMCHSSFKKNTHEGRKPIVPFDVDGVEYKSKSEAIREIYINGKMSRAEIAEMCQCSEANVTIAIQRLEKVSNA